MLNINEIPTYFLGNSTKSKGYQPETRGNLGKVHNFTRHTLDDLSKLSISSKLSLTLLPPCDKLRTTKLYPSLERGCISLATRKDVAREANVSTTAVSYFTNGNGYLSEEKRIRIAEAVKKLDYRPNPVAKNLKMKDSKQLAFFFNEFTNPYHSEVANTAMVTARKQGYTTLLANFVDDNYVLDLCSYMVSGVLICTYEVSEEALDKITEKGIPIVILGSQEKTYASPLITQITIDFMVGIREIIEHLKQKQKKKICYIGARNLKIPTRYRDKKVEVLENILETEEIPFRLDLLLIQPEDAQATSRAILDKLNHKTKRPEVILCSNNTIGLITLRNLADAGISVPEEIEVIAFDDTMFSQTSVPRLSVVDLDANYVSQMATDYLIKKCQQERVHDLKITPKLLHRESTLP